MSRAKTGLAPETSNETGATGNLLPPMNCLVCRQCELLPETDLSKRATLVYCNKQQDKVFLRLEGCPIADPRPAQNPTKNKRGDRWIFYNAVADAFIRLHYPTLKRETIEQVLQRSWFSIRGRANRLGVIRRNGPGYSDKLAENARRGWENCPRDNSFVPAQRDYISGCLKRGFYPGQGGARTIERQERESHIRAKIEQEVAKRGPFHAWRQIKQYIGRQQPGYQRRLKKTRMARNGKARQRQKAFQNTSPMP